VGLRGESCYESPIKERKERSSTAGDILREGNLTQGMRGMGKLQGKFPREKVRAVKEWQRQLCRFFYRAGGEKGRGTCGGTWRIIKKKGK